MAKSLLIASALFLAVVASVTAAPAPKKRKYNITMLYIILIISFLYNILYFVCTNCLFVKLPNLRNLIQYINILMSIFVENNLILILFVICRL